MLIDSDVLIWYIRGNKNAQNVVKNNIPFKISVINQPRRRADGVWLVLIGMDFMRV